MKIKELIKGLKGIEHHLCPNCSLNDPEKDIIDAIIEGLKELDDLRCRLLGVKMCIEGKVKIKSGQVK